MDKWSNISFILSSELRLGIINKLNESNETPSFLSKELEVPNSHISKTLKELEKHGLIVCLTPDRRKSKFYGISKNGKDIITSINEITKSKHIQSTFDWEIPKSYTKDIDNKKIKVKEGVFWIQKQRQLHSLHHITPYQASFAPQIPQYFIRNYSKLGDKVLDPFVGRGTTILEANQNGRVGIGFDISPLAIQIAKVKLKGVTYEEVEKRLMKIDFSKKILNGYDYFKHIYHPDTYSQIMNLKEQLKDDRIDNFIKVIILGRLHGHSSSFFSVFTFNVISPSAEAIRKMSERHMSKIEFRDVVPSILKKSKTVLRDKIIENPSSYVDIADSKNLPLKQNSIDMIITSPPFLGVINYIDDNWLRFWFLGYDREKLRDKLIQTNNIEEYTEFIKKSMKEMNRVLKPGKTCIVEVGDVGRNGKKIHLEDIIVKLAYETGFNVKELLINHISAPKISKAFSENAKNKGTRTNRCVIMKK